MWCLRKLWRHNGRDLSARALNYANCVFRTASLLQVRSFLLGGVVWASTDWEQRQDRWLRPDISFNATHINECTRDRQPIQLWEPFLSRAFSCEGLQSSQKQLHHQDKFKNVAKLLSAHNLRKLDFWICGGYGPNDLRKITPSTYLCFHQIFDDTKDVTARYAT